MERAGTAIELQRNYKTAAKRVGMAKELQRKGVEKTGNAGKHSNTSRTFRNALKRKAGKLQRFQSSEDARTRKTSCLYNRAGTSALIKSKRKNSRTTEARTLRRSFRETKNRPGGTALFLVRRFGAPPCAKILPLDYLDSLFFPARKGPGRQ